MKPTNLLALLLGAVLLAGCKKTETAAAPPPVDDLLPRQAQPKLPTMKIYLGVPHQHPGHGFHAVYPAAADARGVLDEKLS